MTNKYYTQVDRIPLYNYFKAMQGNLSYLWIDNTDLEPLSTFPNILTEMYYQLNKVDTSTLRSETEALIIEAEVAINETPKHQLVHSRRIRENIQLRIEESANNQNTISTIKSAIELVLKIKIDEYKESAQYCLDLYDMAIKKSNKTQE